MSDSLSSTQTYLIPLYFFQEEIYLREVGEGPSQNL